jgi:hypothetical protein
MVSGTLPAAAATLKLLAPGFVDSQAAVTLVAALWLVSIGAVVAKGRTTTAWCRARFAVRRYTALPMEPRGLLAEWDAAQGRMTVLGEAIFASY